ncbi:MAG TPA: hypothetical protein VFF48_02355 [Brevundimonas sp.]|nr:hypothetical protein [Brevundimonas sp.]
MTIGAATLGGRAEFLGFRVGDCGCPEELYLFDGIDLVIHFEPNGDVDAFWDSGDDCADWTTHEGMTRFNGRLAAFAWAASLMQGPPR